MYSSEKRGALGELRQTGEGSAGAECVRRPERRVDGIGGHGLFAKTAHVRKMPSSRGVFCIEDLGVRAKLSIQGI